ncbi:hypothetical protein CPB86DRAFT_870858 [Serendipita vermifera]|nr:hypothetical protein CPB86DRAFT_870858 [Serendipita vermifera]
MDQTPAIPLPHPRRNPSATEIRWCKNAIKNISEEISSLENQTHEPTTRLVLLQQQRNNYASYISPFRRLPQEILNEILSICIDNGDYFATLMRICGTIRHVVIGMSSVWTKVVLPADYSHKCDTCYGGIYCASEERLEMVLTRAGTAPLELHLDLKANNLQPIVLRNCIIHSLHLGVSVHDTTFPAGFEQLNLSALKELCITTEHNDLTERIMDLTMRSNMQEMDISITFGEPPTATILNHGLFSRAKSLTIRIGWEGGDNSYSFTPANISLSHLKSLIFDRNDEYDYMDFSEVVTICSWPGGTSTTPIALTKLSLAFVNFKFSNIATGKPYDLPYLKILRLERLEVEGPLQKYLVMPSLQRLELLNVNFSPGDDNEWREYKGSVYDPVLHTDILLSEDFLNLETLHLSGMETDDELVVKLSGMETDDELDSEISGKGAAGGLDIKLRPCPKLKTLRVCSLSLETFIPSFIESLAETGSFPSLKKLELDDSWPTELDMSYEEFVEHCFRVRPDMDLCRIND